ncbi:MAG: hypothetical protein ACRDVP_02450 [Acidimicrobiales bacterium]
MTSVSKVYDPRGFAPTVVNRTFAPRLKSLEDKVVYAVIVPFANTPTFMDQLRAEFAEALPRTELRIVSASGRDKSTLEMKEEIVESADAAVVGIGL